MIKLIIFDLDGTLLNAYEAIEKSLNFTLRKMGYPLASAFKARRAVGMGDINFINRFVKKADADAALKQYRAHHKISLLGYSRLMPEAKNILGLLKKRGYKLAVASNRPKEFSNILLRHLGLRRYFDMALCGKSKEDLKPSPRLLLKIMKKLKVKKSEAVYVGDMAIDVEAGNNAGIRPIAILGGSSFRYELEKARPFKIIRRLSELLKII